MFPLLADKILSHINRAGKEDYQTFDYVQHILRYRKKGETGEYYLEQQHADDDTADLSGASDEGDAADDAGRDGVSRS